MRWIAGVFFGVVLLQSGATSLHAADAAAEFGRVMQPFLAQHCERCHGEKKHKGELRVDTLVRDFAAPLSAGHWADVMERISSGEMPPENEPKPKADEAARVVEWIAQQLKDGEASRMAKRDRITFHKLTREEYANTIDDLLGVKFDVTDPSGLPEDTQWQGFDRIGSVMTVAPMNVEKYFAAAETILNEAMPQTATKPFSEHRGWQKLRGGNEALAKELGIVDKVRTVLWPHANVQASATFPVAGEYRGRIKLSGMRPPKGRAPHVTLYARGLDRMVFETDVDTAEDKPATYEFTFHVPAGNHNIYLTNDSPGPSILATVGHGDGNRFYTTIKDSISHSTVLGRGPWSYKLTDEDGVPMLPFLIVDFVDFEGPLQTDFPSLVQQRFVPKGAQDAAQARAALAPFVERAFRRPVRAEELDRLEKLVASELKSGEKYESAVRAALLSVLCSTDFLYLVEGSGEKLTTTINDWELASRLSYFLWSTTPDVTLIELARAGKLHEKEVLRGQVARMMRDPKSQRFASSFPYQWLQLKRVGMFAPDKKLYPEYDTHLEKSMVAEGSAFFTEVLRKNSSIRDFIDSNWAMLNARLASHYGISGVSGNEFTRVALRPEDHRGGILCQGGVLSLTSDGQRHRPVHRGKWVLETVFNKPPPPPPANVKPIEPTPSGKPKATLRMKLDAHKSDANCASCHKKIDPLGLAFDNYDAIGRWRTEEKVKDGDGDNPKVDASGTLPDGRAFADAVEFRKLLMGDAHKFAGAFIEKLATYALRRPMALDDRRALAELCNQSKATDYKLGDIVEALILSDLFQQR